MNDAKPEWVIDKVKIAINDFLQVNPTKRVEDVTIACFGLAFKPDIEDLRESPALSITRSIAVMHKGRVVAVEPNIHILDGEAFELATFAQAAAAANIAVLLVDHKEFKSIGKPSGIDVVDTKGIW